MSWLEFSALAQALRAALVYGWFLNRQSGLMAAGAYADKQGLTVFGWEILLLIMVTMVAGIVVQVAFVMAAVASGQEATDGIDDERDKSIDARSNVHGFTLAGAGFLGAAYALWNGWDAVWAFNVQIAGMALADFTMNTYRFYRYVRGG